MNNGHSSPTAVGTSSLKVATLVIAMWGASLSTFLAVRQIWLDRVRLVLVAWTEAHKISNEPISHLCTVVVRVDNRGRRPVWISEVGWAAGSNVTWRTSPEAHYDARGRVDLPLFVDVGQRVDIPVWALADAWPFGRYLGLRAGVRSGGHDWLVAVGADTKVTG